MLKRNIQLVIFLLSCAALTLALAPGQLAKLKSHVESADILVRADAPKQGAHEKISATNVFSANASTLTVLDRLSPLRYETFFRPTALVNIFTVTTTADNGSNTSP